MAVNEVTPSLGELASAGQSEAPVATIAPTSSSELIQTLNQNARFKAQNDWNKYLNFQSNLKDAYANTAAVEQMDVLSADKPELQQDAAKLYSFIAKNPDAFSGKNQQLAGEMQAMYGNLLSKATLSKQDNLFDKANRTYLVQNNELNTDENKKKIDSFAQEQPLGSRKAYNLDLQPIFDANAFSNTLKDQVGAQYSPQTATEITGYDPINKKYIPGEEYIHTTETKTIPYKDYIDKWNASLSLQSDKNNQPIKNWAVKQYDTLPEDVKKNVSLPDFWQKIGDKLYGSETDDKGQIKDIVKTTKDEIKENTGYGKREKLDLDKKELEEKSKHNRELEALGWANLKFDKDKLAKAGATNTEATEAKDYASGLFTKLQGLADKDGIIPADKLKELTADELKYLGTSETKDNKFTINPLKLGSKDNLRVNKNGTIQVLQNEKNFFSKDKVNEPKGAAIDLKNIALNKLGDVLVTSTGKESASYEALKSLYNTKPEDKKQTGGFDPAKYSPITKGGITYYVDPTTRKVYNENGEEIK